MADAPLSWTDDVIVDRIGIVLRVGVLGSAAIILAGGLIYLFHHGGEKEVARHSFEPMAAEFSSPGAISRAALAGRRSAGRPGGPEVQLGMGRGRALIGLGLLLLIATPVLRVAFSVYAFLRRREFFYVVLPLIVLTVLLYGLFSRHIH
jgi:uncharacterized membrane protein